MGTVLEVRWKSRAIKSLRRLVPQQREQVIAKVEQYAADPDSLRNQVRRLANSEYLRLRVGSYRVLFTVQHGDIAIMVVERVRHRREAYD